ncbi:helix-turn-helix domain-containing protein [Thermosediminibacter litoriperuensis]|uniref:helix-turn-helix domain-containing protein n=1 Tax=Thermosediminibacter litoriperuensis TaxID=291989 RepID=UPI001FE5E30B|nr:helix-turn-helix domain-containing protein [Thermosediminibacter litoriperuensis]
MTSNYFTRFGEIIARNGIASIPDAIFSFQKELGLSVGECWFVAQILRFKWTTELPRPSLRKMASYTGVSERTLHNYKNSLVEKGYLILQNRLDRTGRKDTNYYDFSPLFDAIIELLNSKDNTANPIEEGTEELEDGERVSENISDRGVSENFSDSICKFFSGVSENFSEHKQKNIQTEEYINNNNPPSRDGGNDTRPEAGVVVSLSNLYFEITGRDKGRFIKVLVAKYGYEKVRKAIEYLREQLKRNNIEHPEGFLVRLLEEDWDLSTFDKIRHMEEKRSKREEEQRRRLKELMSIRASHETAQKYLRMIKQKLRGDDVESENDIFLECGREHGQDLPGDSLRLGVEETQNRGGPGRF